MDVCFASSWEIETRSMAFNQKPLGQRMKRREHGRVAPNRESCLASIDDFILKFQGLWGKTWHATELET